MKKLLSIALSILLIVAMLPLSVFTASAESAQINTTPIYSSIVRDNVPAEWWGNGVNYPRIIQLQHGSSVNNNALLVTFEEHSGGYAEMGYPIWRSNDLGQTWEYIAKVTDPVNNNRQRAEWSPSFYELPEDFGGMKKGTLLLAGASVDAEHSSNSAIQLYKSEDGGYNWDFISTVAKGGGMSNGTTYGGVWEPELELINGELICYYSDETDPEHSQKISYKTSKDGIKWSSDFEAVAFDDESQRPGMAVVTKISDESYFMVYELCNKNSKISNSNVYFKTSTNGKNWTTETKLVGSNQETLSGAPYTAWTPFGGENGTIFVGAANMDGLEASYYFASQDNGATWSKVLQPIQFDDSVSRSGYSSGITFSADGNILFAVNTPTDEKVTPAEGRAVRTRVESATVELVEGATTLDVNKYGTNSIEAFIEYAGGYSNADISWSEDFEITTTPSVTMHEKFTAKSEITNGAWNLGRLNDTNKENGSLKGLLGRNVGDFAISFELKMGTEWGTHDYIFHSTTGWPGAYDSYIRFARYQNEDKTVTGFKLTLVNGGNAIVDDVIYSKNTVYNIALISKGETASVYVWENGTEVPSVPAVVSVAETTKTGDFHVHNHEANDFIDNIKVYEAGNALTHEEISNVVGKKVSVKNLKYENHFNDAVTNAISMNNADTNIVANSKWSVNGPKTSSHTAAGLTGNNKMADFVLAFEYKKVNNNGTRNIIFHRTTVGNANGKSDSMLQIMSNGQVRLYNKGTNTADYVKTETGYMANNKTYNIIIKSIATSAYAYVWEKGTEAPKEPTLTLTVETSAQGDIHFGFYDTAAEYIDSIRVYELELDSEMLSTITGQNLSDDLITYENHFDSQSDISGVTYDKAVKTNSVDNGAWNLLATPNTGYLKNLTGKSLRNFVVSMELTEGNLTGTRQIYFHGMNTVKEQRSSIYINYDGTVSMRNSGNSGTGSIKISAGVTYNFVLVSIDNTASAYIWAKGSAMPTTPTIVSTKENTEVGDISLSFYHDKNTVADKIDNIVVYDLPITTEDIAAVSGETLTDEMLVVKNYLNNTDETPANVFPEYIDKGTSAIKNNQWYVNKEIATDNGIVGKDLGDFVAAFEYKTGGEWGNRRFTFHSTTGWPDQAKSYVRFNHVSGDNTPYFTVTLCNNGVTATTDTVLNWKKYYNIVIKSVGLTTSVYIWQQGTEMPTEPTVSATAETAIVGDLHLYTFDAASDYIDNIRVFDLGNSIPTINASDATLRKEFVSGINFSFDYELENGETVIEQGIKVLYAGNSQVVTFGNDERVLSVVASGELSANNVKAQAYLVFTDNRGIKYEIYSDTVSVYANALGYTKVTYGDATGDGLVDIRDLVRFKKVLSGIDSSVELVSANVEFDGIDGHSAIEISMLMKIILLDGMDLLIPTDINYVNF